ncbi:hypothetical protein GCK32_020416, partial [Trichostrongylus colubriformis]
RFSYCTATVLLVFLSVKDQKCEDFWELMRLLLILNALFDVVFTLKILIYSGISGFSHMRFMGTIADILHDAGHDVAVEPPTPQPPNRQIGSEISNGLTIDTIESTFRDN